MRFTKFGKALSMGVLSAGVIFGVTSCVESYTVGFLYVTGTVTASSGSSGIISGYKIDHNTGKLNTIDGLPVSSGGANPVRAVLTLGSRFLYVLNRGVNNAGNGDCYGTGSRRVPERQHHRVCRGRQWHLDASGDLLHAGPESVPAYRRLLGQLFDGSGPRCAGQRQPVEHRQLRARPGNRAPKITTCGDITVFQINSDHGPLVAGRQCPGHRGQRLRAHLLPGSRQPCRFCSQLADTS